MEEENLDVVEETTEEVTNDVTEDEGVEIVKEAEQDNAPSEQDIDKLVEERANKLTEERINKRLARQKNKYEKEISKYKELGRIVETGLGVSNIDEAISQTKNFYTDQGIDIPDNNPNKEWEERVLGRAEAEEISNYGYEEMEAEANRLSNIPLDKMTVREKEVFNTLCTKLTEMKDEQELISKGVDSNILKDDDFNKFRSQFNSSVKIGDIYSMYNKMTGKIKEIPASPGSAKTTSPVNPVKDYISPEDYDKLTKEQLKDPKVMAIVEKSMQSWYKD